MSTAIHLALRARAEALTGFPALREHENVAFTPPTDGSMWSEEDYIPQPSTLTTTRTRGRIEGRGLYVIRLYATANTGMKTLRDLATALCAWFTGWVTTLGDGTLLRARDDLMPYAGQITNQNGPAFCAVTIPYRIEQQLAA